MPIDAPFILTPPAATGLEGLVLNGLSLNTGPGGGVYSLEALDMPPPPKLAEWAKGADSDGQALVRTPLFDNRTITFQVRIENVGTMDLALTALGVLVDQVQEAEQQPGGSPLVWTPAGGTRSLTAYVLTGMVTGMPISVAQAAGWFIHRPFVTVTLTCKPFLYGTEIAGSVVNSGSNPYATVTIPGVAGDVPAEGRLVITDTAGVDRRYVEWGLQQRYYDPATSLVQLSTSMALIGGTRTVRAGSFSATVVSGTAPVGTAGTLCSTNPLGHVGTFRVRCRVYTSASTASVRLTWTDGSNSPFSNPYALVPAGGTFVDLDLGLVTIAATLPGGVQTWAGYIEVTDTVGGNTVGVDYLAYIPVSEGYGKARGLVLGGVDTVACYANQAIEMRSASTIRVLGGPYYGAPPLYPGARFFVPQSGSASRTSRIFARMFAADTELGGNTTLLSAFSVQPFWTPRYHVAPR